MNLYAVLEGMTEDQIYPRWFGYAFPGMTRVQRIEDVVDNHCYIISNMGYPDVLDTVRDAVRDLSNSPACFDILVVAVDADDVGTDARRRHVEEALEGCPVRTLVAIHNCCMETWLLGNRAFILSHDGTSQRRPHDPELAPFRAHYDVRLADPEAMFAPNAFIGSRAEYHYRYLKAAFNERGETYTKRRPGEATELYYLEALIHRRKQTGDLDSFGRFLRETQELGAAGPFSDP